MRWAVAVLFASCSSPATTEDVSRENVYGSKPADKLSEACTAVSTETLAAQDDRADYLDEMANKYESVGLGFGPTARLAARAIRKEQHAKGAEYLTQLDTICSGG